MKSSGTISRGGEQWVLDNLMGARPDGAGAYHLHSSGQQVWGARVEILAWTSLFLSRVCQGLPLRGADCHRGCASPRPVYCVCSLRSLATGEGTVEILVFVCSELREKAPLST